MKITEPTLETFIKDLREFVETSAESQLIQKPEYTYYLRSWLDMVEPLVKRIRR